MTNQQIDIRLSDIENEMDLVRSYLEFRVRTKEWATVSELALDLAALDARAEELRSMRTFAPITQMPPAPRLAFSRGDTERAPEPPPSAPMTSLADVARAYPAQLRMTPPPRFPDIPGGGTWLGEEQPSCGLVQAVMGAAGAHSNGRSALQPDHSGVQDVATPSAETPERN